MLNTNDMREIGALLKDAPDDLPVTVTKEQCLFCGASGPWQKVPSDGRSYPADWLNFSMTHAEENGKDHYKHHNWLVTRNPGRYVGRF